MSMRGRLLTLMLVGVVLAGCSGVGNSGKAALVNGKAITLADYNKQVQLVQDSMVAQGIDPKTAEGKATIEQMRSDVLDQMIDIELMRQGAAKEGITVTKADEDERIAKMKTDAGGADVFKKSMEDAKLTEAEFRTLIVRDQLVYERLYDKLANALPQSSEQVRARHILLNTEQEAANALSRLTKGEDFAAVTKEISLDTSSKDDGGDLGFFPRGLLDPAFETAIFTMKVQEIKTVKTDYGYHVVQVLEHAADRALDPEYVQYLGEEAFNTFLENLRTTAKVERYVKFAAAPTPSQ